MTLIEQIFEAVQSGALTQPFTAEQLKLWMLKSLITKSDGKYYAKASVEAILSNSDVSNNPTTNRNRKVLISGLNPHGKKEYWF